MKRAVLLLGFLISLNVYGQKRFIVIDSTEIWINTVGIEDIKEGQPIVVFESGLGTPMGNWDNVLEGVSKLAPLITYDRPGIGMSEPTDQLPTLENVSNRLVKILEHLELKPPFILVGHSLGALYARGFSIYYPEMLAGLVLIDPADFTETHLNKRAYYDVLNWPGSLIDSTVETLIDRRKKRHEQAPPPIQREGLLLEEIREREFQEIANNTLPNIPVHILTGGRFDMPDELLSKDYDEELLFRSKMKHRISRWIGVVQSVEKGRFFYSSDAGHFVHYDDPELVISSIHMVLKDYELLKLEREQQKVSR